MRRFLHTLALILAGATEPRGNWGVMIHYLDGSVTRTGMTEFQAKCLVEAYSQYNRDPRVRGARLIVP